MILIAALATGLFLYLFYNGLNAIHTIFAIGFFLITYAGYKRDERKKNEDDN